MTRLLNWSNDITFKGNYNLNNTGGFGTTTSIKIVHDNTKHWDAITGITAAV